MELIRRFTPETFARALEAWSWLTGLHGKTPRFASPIGDVFLEAEDGYWLLDTIDGALTRRWSDGPALQADINRPEAQQELLMPELVAAAEANGLVPTESQILSFKVLPVLGGPIAADNLEVSDFVVTLDIAGQIHRQIKDLPPGTPISNIKIG